MGKTNSCSEKIECWTKDETSVTRPEAIYKKNERSNTTHKQPIYIKLILNVQYICTGRRVRRNYSIIETERTKKKSVHKNRHILMWIQNYSILDISLSI